MKKAHSPKSNTEISKSKVLLVEGQDEENLFSELLVDLNLANDIQIISVGGKEKFPIRLKGLKVRSGYELITSIGIVRDADENPTGAFQSVCSALKNVGLPKPIAPSQPTIDNPKVTVMIIPDAETKGMIENVCLESVKDDPAIACVDQYFQCLQRQLKKLPKNPAKARVHAFLASRDWLEIAHFEYLQRCLEDYELVVPTSSAVATAKVHVFLASRYTPNLRLGEAAKKQKDSDRYWQFNHPAFDKIKQFLRIL